MSVTGAETKHQVWDFLDHLAGLYEVAAELRDALAPCTVLTPEEAAQVRAGIAIHPDEPTDVMVALERAALGLLSPDEADREEVRPMTADELARISREQSSGKRLGPSLTDTGDLPHDPPLNEDGC